MFKAPNITRNNKRTTNIGRPKKLSVRDRRLLKRSIDQLRQVNANFTMKELIRLNGPQCTDASYSTLYGEIKSMGFKFFSA